MQKIKTELNKLCIFSDVEKDFISQLEVKCPRCETVMDDYVACEMRCKACGGLLDCSDQ